MLSGIAVIVGIMGALLALVLLRLISFFTNLFFYQRISIDDATPAGHELGPVVIVLPIIGALVVGMMARYGSEAIRGHGIPEAIEAILLKGSRVDARVATLKPISSAISIGSGGPFGAEGPIIMTAGAFGSLLSQLIHLSSVERKALLVAGAAAGMSATFSTPLAAILLAVELLLFEWKPRSLIPCAVASITAYVLRHYLLGEGPLFPIDSQMEFAGPLILLCCLLVGLSAGMLSAALTAMVYFAEDSFGRLPIHWMWWPAIGGLVIGIGGFLFPRALGVGYETIGATLQDELSLKVIVGVLIVKSIIWSMSLGSGTSGGVLAPLLMMGAALGSVEAHILPDAGVGFWPLVGMAAVMGGTMRAPFTGTVFALELTHELNMLVPVLIAVTASYAFTVLALRRSILTEKISRRGFHLSREYSLDPLEIFLVRDSMQTQFATISADTSKDDLAALLAESKQEIYPVTDGAGTLITAVRAGDLRTACDEGTPFCDLIAAQPALSELPRAYSHEPLRVIAHRMASLSVTRLLVVNTPETAAVGIITLDHLLAARGMEIESETKREGQIDFTQPLAYIRLPRAK